MKSAIRFLIYGLYSIGPLRFRRVPRIVEILLFAVIASTVTTGRAEQSCGCGNARMSIEYFYYRSPNPHDGTTLYPDSFALKRSVRLI